jgi:hypothetical protein
VCACVREREREREREKAEKYLLIVNILALLEKLFPGDHTLEESGALVPSCYRLITDPSPVVEWTSPRAPSRLCFGVQCITSNTVNTSSEAQSGPREVSQQPSGL